MMASEEFAENRDFLLPAWGAGVDKEAFEKFVEQHGPEVVKGYMQALTDILPRVEDIFMMPRDTRRQKMALELHNQIENLLHLNSDLSLDKKSNPDANLLPPNPA